jgi:nucleotide-binding universal stress UspA family protein
LIKNILVPQDGSAYSASSLECALWVAKKFDATLTGIYVVDSVALEGSFLHDMSGSMGFEPFMDFSSKMKGVLEANGEVLLDAFEERCKSEGVTCHKATSYGVVASEICEQARLSDLIVMGRRGVNAGFEYALMGSTTESVVRKSEKPVIIVPEIFKEPVRPVLAYDAGSHSSKVLKSAVEFAKAATLPLTVLNVTASGSGDEALKEVEDYITPYGIDFELKHLTGDPHSEIANFCNDGSDLIFMGATHHTRIVALILGSVTEYVMRMVETPFFIER